MRFRSIGMLLVLVALLCALPAGIASIARDLSLDAPFTERCSIHPSKRVDPSLVVCDDRLYRDGRRYALLRSTHPDPVRLIAVSYSTEDAFRSGYSVVNVCAVGFDTNRDGAPDAEEVTLSPGGRVVAVFSDCTPLKERVSPSPDETIGAIFLVESDTEQWRNELILRVYQRIAPETYGVVFSGYVFLLLFVVLLVAVARAAFAARAPRREL